MEFVEDEDNAIFMSSHISSDLEKVADYIIFIDNGKIILGEYKDKLIYEYGIARMREKDFNALDKSEYISFRKRGLQYEVLTADKKKLQKAHKDVLIDNATVDEIETIAYEEMPTGGWEEYCVSWDEEDEEE